MSLIKKFLLPIFILFILVGCSIQNEKSTADESTPTPATKLTPAPIPGAAPDFQSIPSQEVSLIQSMQTEGFWRVLFGWWRRFTPNEAGLIWTGALITILVAFNFKKIKSWHNLDLVLLLIPSIFLYDLVTLGTRTTQDIDPSVRTLFTLSFTGLFIATTVLFIRSVINARKKKSVPWEPNLHDKALIGLLIFFLVANTFVAINRSPDDAGNYTNLGAFRMMQTGKFPYTDPKLQGGAAATYGPALYIAHMPFQLILSPILKSPLGDSTLVRKLLVGTDNPNFNGPPVMATKLAMLTFHYLAVACLILIGRNLANPSVGWGLGVLYTCSAYVHGIGGEQYAITGMPFISHIAPAGLTLLAFYLLRKPLASGSILAIAGSTLYYPFFFFPLWLGYYFWQRKARPTDWIKFTIGFVVVACLVVFVVNILTAPPVEGSKWHVIYESTVGHQEGDTAYGSSIFSFWGLYPKLDHFWQKPFVSDLYLLRPTFLLFAVYLLATFFLVRGRTISQFAFLTASIAIGVQLWKSHAGGSYVEWYYPFFLIGLLAQSIGIPGNDHLSNYIEKPNQLIEQQELSLEDI